MIKLFLRLRYLLPLMAFALAGLSSSVSYADSSYPDRPVSLTVSYSPGGATDFQARIVTMLAGKKDFLGQPVVIFNRPGAGGRVGWNDFASGAKKNGYELSAYNVPHFIAQSVVFDTKYNIDNLEPIANWGADPAVLIVGKDSPINSLADFARYARENPFKTTVSGAGLYVGHHIAFLQIQQALNVDLTYVPHQGGAPALKSVIGGQVMAGVNNLSDAYRSRDNLKIIAIADLQRDSDFLPDVPTFKEQGFNVDDSSVNFRGIMAPKGTSKAIIEKLEKKFLAMFDAPRVKKRMKSGGSPLRVMTRAQVINMWKERQKFLIPLLENLKPQ